MTSSTALRPGLVSITFRHLSPREIVALCIEANIHGIEWGGDVHVPPDDAARAREVAQQMRDADLETACYGSYYRFGNDDASFEPVLDTAQILGAPVVRVWAGNRGSQEYNNAERLQIAERLRQAAGQAQSRGLHLALEWHGGTLTDSLESGLDLLQSVDHAHCGTLWQPTVACGIDQREQELRAVLPWLRHVHVFQWRERESGRERLPLSEGRDEWLRYLRILQAHHAPPQARWLLLEFVRDNAPEAFLEDVAALQQWLRELEQES